MDDDTNTNPFKLMTSSLVNFLGIETLSNDQVLKLSNDILTDEDTWNKYFYETGAWYKGASQTACDTYTCKRAEACLVAFIVIHGNLAMLQVMKFYNRGCMQKMGTHRT